MESLEQPIPRQPTPAERELMAGFARMEVSLGELCDQLEGMLTVDFGKGVRRLTSQFLAAEPAIRIELCDIQHARNQNSGGTVSDRELSEWAAMLLMNDAYGWEGTDEEEIADSLNQLSTPWLFGSSRPTI